MLMNMAHDLSPLEIILLAIAVAVICFCILSMLDDFDAQ